jgi:hypothetical protein
MCPCTVTRRPRFVSVVITFFNSADSNVDYDEIEVQTAKLVTMMAGSTAILVFTVLAAVGIYLAVNRGDEEGDRD